MIAPPARMRAWYVASVSNRGRPIPPRGDRAGASAATDRASVAFGDVPIERSAARGSASSCPRASLAAGQPDRGGGGGEDRRTPRSGDLSRGGPMGGHGRRCERTSHFGRPGLAPDPPREPSPRDVLQTGRVASKGREGRHRRGRGRGRGGRPAAGGGPVRRRLAPHRPGQGEGRELLLGADHPSRDDQHGGDGGLGSMSPSPGSRRNR